MRSGRKETKAVLMTMYGSKTMLDMTTKKHVQFTLSCPCSRRCLLIIPRRAKEMAFREMRPDRVQRWIQPHTKTMANQPH